MISLDIWCALNSSFGGPLLAIVTVGGVLSIGRALLAFPDRDKNVQTTTGRKNNNFRFWVLIIGIITCVTLCINVLLYVKAFGLLRTIPNLCQSDAPLPKGANSALPIFLWTTVVSAIACFSFSWAFAELKRRLS